MFSWGAVALRESAKDPKLCAEEGRFVRPAHLRAVSSEFKGAHQLQALALAEFPGDKSAGRYKLPSDVRSVISVMLQHGANLPTLQESQVAKLRSLARVCKSITEEMKRILAASLPPSVCAVGDCMNVAFALVLAKERQWQHYWISHVLLLWFPITGDMESTGVLQPRDEPHKVEQGIRRVELLRLFGWPIEAPKSQEAGVVNKFLGMMGDTSLASTLNRSEADPLEVSFYPNDDWVGNILDIMDQCDPAAGGSGTMTPHQAEVLLGKLGFLLRGAHGSIGREASQPIFSRKHDLTGQLAWNEALTHSFSFFLKLFTRFPVLTWRLDVDETPWLLVYTDACRNTRFGGLGGCDLRSGYRPEICVVGDMPQRHRRTLCTRGTYNQPAGASGYSNGSSHLPAAVGNRRALWFADSCSALSACVHGYADKLDMAKMANSVRLALRFLGVRLRFNGAPTDANIADTPSRVERDYETSRGVRSGTRRYDAT